MTAVTQKMSVEAFAAHAAAHGPCELVKGEVRTLSPTGWLHGKIVARLTVRVGRFVEERRLGEVLGAETGFRLDDGREPSREPSVRAPDVSYVTSARAAAIPDTAGYAAIAPDLVAEVLSPDDRASEVAAKVQWWLEQGVRLVWVVDPANRTVQAHLPGGEARRLGVNDTLTGGEVLPGFELRLAELFR
jgi:Uma2 family endonuclease